MYFKLIRISVSALLIFLFSSLAYSQELKTVLQPDISFTWKKSDKVSIHSKTAAYQFLSDISEKSSLNYAETSLGVSYKLSSKLTIKGSYLFRLITPLIAGDSNENRLIEELTYKSAWGANSLSQRLRIENRFVPNKYRTRLRYKLGIKIPLANTSNSNYLIIGDEFLANTASDVFIGQNRLGFGTGWKTSTNNAIELALEYRTGNLFNDGSLSHSLVITSSFKFNN